MEQKNILSLKNIQISFIEGKPLLNNLNLEANKGEMLSLLGPGGSGKSTLLKIILGLVNPQRGNICLFGKNIASLGHKESSKTKMRVGMAFQQGALFDFMTVQENILFAIENMTQISENEAQERVKNLLGQVNLPDSGDKFPRELSGGMRRRVGIVRAMATNPELVLLDEPTAGLDPVTTTIVLDMIKRIGLKIGATMICVTSSVEVAFRFSDTVAVLKDGKIAGKGNKQALLALKDDWLHNFLTIRDT